MSGLLWFNGKDFQGFQKLRHACDQGDGIQGYGYHKHNGRDFALQKINDTPSNIKITTSFLKVPGGEHGGDWGVRIHGIPIDDSVPAVTDVLFYFGLEGDGGLDIMSRMSKKGIVSPVKLEGDSPELGDFEIQIVDGPLNTYLKDGIDQSLERTQWWGTQVDKGDIWRAKDLISESIVLAARDRLGKTTDQQDAFTNPYKYFTLKNTLDEAEGEVANLYTFQKVFKGEFQFDVLFRSASSDNPITSEMLERQLLEKEKEFNQRFEDTFLLSQKGYSRGEVSFAQYLLSNLIGGIGYFYGTSVIDRSHPPMQDEESFKGEPARPELAPAQSLFSATPSRPFFPRGFFWDEGFHQLVIGTWDNDLSLDIIKHWTNMIDDNGWVAREQILGEEARSKVPPEFQTQFPHYANPPTLYLSIKQFVDRLNRHKQEKMLSMDGSKPKMGGLEDLEILSNLHLDDDDMSKQWLLSIYPKLRKNWKWFRATQRGHIEMFGREAPNSEEAYRWRGRTPDHTLTSGLDDYPRGKPSIGELHQDLHSWVAFATRLLLDISSKLGSEFAADHQEYDKVLKDLLINLDALHWSQDENMYCDQALDEGMPDYVCHKGYVTLFPMTLGLLPHDSPKLGALLNMIESEKELWSPFGLRSLSASDPFYNTGEKYWRGPIWLNINYLTLQSLHNNYMNQPGPYQEQAQRIYKNLRKNIIQTVYNDYKKTGYVWEQYDAETGEGMRSHPFTGWTSLVVLIMSEKF
ncbi:glycoside hydrolase family 63 protein [Backusella circina FSU 941]|nr:glycoside hydrolase family 63 protein [Backusella circina FSU 941]